MTLHSATRRAPILAMLRRRLAAARWTHLAVAVARVGYVARGAVYLAVGAVALLAALGLSPHAKGALGAIQAWADWPAGVVLLWFMALGLGGFTAWRVLQAIFDIDRQGLGPSGLATRLGQGVSGLVYGGLALSVVDLLHAAHNLRRPSEHAEMVRHIETFLTFKGGTLMVIAAGLFILACGLGNMVRAVFSHFGRTLDCEEAIVPWAGAIARIGYFSRGVALSPVGFYMVRAGLHARAPEAHGVDGALEALHRQPMGAWLMGLTGVGLMAFGLFAFLEAIYRPICTEERKTQNRKVRKLTAV